MYFKKPSLFKEKWLLQICILLLILITFLTNYEGSTDIGDYADTAKYFSGHYPAKIRSSHSYLFGLVHSPFVGLTKNFFSFRVSSVIFLLILIYSVYIATGKNKNALWLMLLSPIVWYMAPWINPIQLSSLLFFGAYYLIKKYNNTEKLRFLFISGTFVGLSWAFWDAITFFFIIFAISFFYNKKFYYFILFFISVIIGLLPKLLLDQIIFNFAFMGIIRYFFGIITSLFFKGIYGTMTGYSIINVIMVFLFLPLFTYKLISRKIWYNDRSTFIFIIFSILLLIKNPQIRYTLLLLPIITFEIVYTLTKKQFRKQIIFSTFLIVVSIVPYIIQINYSSNATEFSSILSNIDRVEIYENQENLIKKDLKEISIKFPNNTFVVGNAPDNYATLAHLYWGKEINEFISIEDYNLFFENNSVLFEKRFMPTPKIKERRQIWVAGGINKNENDDTDYESIKFGIGIDEPIKLDGFSVIKRYHILYISEKTESPNL